MAKVGMSYNIPETELKRLKAEVSRKASMANKRLKRLERNNLTELPAYKSWREYGGGKKFSVAGKDYNELQAELARVDHFINSKTSLVRQANKHMKEIAEMAGVKYRSVAELPYALSNFFELSSKIEQYLRQIEGSASAIGYQKIWEVVNTYVKDTELDLAGSETDIESVMQEMSELVGYEEIMKSISSDTGGWFTV